MQVKLRTLREGVEINLGMAYAIFTSWAEAGTAPDTSLDDAVQPGRGMSLVVDVVVESLSSVYERQN